MPPQGAAFNDPAGTRDQRVVLMRRVIGSINHTPRGEYIRIAAYSFDLKPVADALIDAHRRGVHVQIVLNDNWTSGQTMRLRRVLGRNPNRRHFVRICEGSCRGGPGNLHLKVYAFTRTGGARNVVMTGSANMTERAVKWQWNDMVTLVGVKGLHDTFVKIFNQLKYDKIVRPRWVTYSDGGNVSAQFYRTSTSGSESTTTSRLPTADEDPVLKRLKAINCDAVAGSGIDGKSVIRIMMYGWQGTRGQYLADRVVQMHRRGCNIKVLTSVAGGGVIKRLNEGKVPVLSMDYDYIVDETTGEEKVNYYSHLKAMTLNGTYQGKPVKMTWTGSENWSSMSFRNDEIILAVNRLSMYVRYRDEFNFLWKTYGHRVGFHPDGPPGAHTPDTLA